MNKSDKAVLGAAQALVSKEEIKRLILEAQCAWRMQCQVGLCDEEFDAWRHAALYDAVRKTSFRAVGQAEFGKALGYFEKLAGREPNTRWGHTNHAIAQRESGPEGDRRRAEYKLRETAEQVAGAFGDEPEQALAYACVLLKTIHHTDLPRATAKQIWQVAFTLRNRAAARLRKQTSAAAAAAAAESTIEIGVGE